MLMSQTQSNSSRKILVILALSLFIIALILVIVSSMTPGSKRSLVSGSSSFADGYKAARDQAASFGFPGISDPVTVLTGPVLEVKNGAIVIDTKIFVHEKVDGIGTKRVIALAKGGTVSLRLPMDQEKFAKATKEFEAKIKNADPGTITPPAMYEDVEIKISDIAVGDTVMIEGDGSDLRLKASVEAKTIVVYRKPIISDMKTGDATQAPVVNSVGSPTEAKPSATSGSNAATPPPTDAN